MKGILGVYHCSIIIGGIPNNELDLCSGLLHCDQIFVPNIMINTTLRALGKLVTAIAIIDTVSDPDKVLCEILQVLP